MTTTAVLYTNMPKAALSGLVNWPSGTVKCLLLTSSYTPNQDGHQYASDLSGEVTDASYSRQSLTGKSLATDSASNTISMLADSPEFTALTATFRYAVFILDTGTDSTSPLLTLVDFGADQAVAAANYTVTVPTLTGIGQFTVD